MNTLLASSPFATVKEAQEFIDWFNETGQIVSAWDVHKYTLAQNIVAEECTH